MRSLAMSGRIVTCGSTSGVKAEVSMPRLFFRHAGLLGSTMGNASEFEAVLKAIDHGLRPVVDRVFPLDEVQSALSRLDAAEQFGKVVLSVGVVIGVAFGAVVTGFVKDLVTPLIAAIGGNPNFGGLYFTVNNSKFLYGDFFNLLLSFLLIAGVIYFLVVLPFTAMIARSHK